MQGDAKLLDSAAIVEIDPQELSFSLCV